jgi:hypothetical protein
MMKSRILTTCMPVLLPLLAVGCQAPTQGQAHGLQPVSTQRTASIDCLDEGGIQRHYEYDFSNSPGGWYYTDSQGNRHYRPSLPPNCNAPLPVIASIPSSRAGLGLEPDANGRFNPVIWVSDYKQEGAEPGVDDRLVLVLAAESSWSMPYDTDTNLLESIGEQNISFAQVDVGDTSQPEPVLIVLAGIRLGDAIKVAAGLGASKVSLTVNSSLTYQFLLDGDLETYSGAYVCQNEEPIAWIELE